MPYCAFAEVERPARLWPNPLVLRTEIAAKVSSSASWGAAIATSRAWPKDP